MEDEFFNNIKLHIMCTLTELQKKQIIQREKNLGAGKILEYIQKYNNLSIDDFPQMADEKKNKIKEQLNKQPNPVEQKEWNDLIPLLDIHTQDLIDKLAQYIKKWENIRPFNNHVDEAIAKMSFIEDSDWANVDPLSSEDLLGHLAKYPHTIHKREIDDSCWELINKENIQEIQNYICVFPQGNHTKEANDILKSIKEWDHVKNTNDIFSVFEYVKKNPDSPFINQAQILLMGLKQQELRTMKANASLYDVSILLRLLDKGVFTDFELYNARVLTPNVLAIIRNQKTAVLPDMIKVMEKCTPSCPEGYTDVFFWGIPSTGKTCVLMGLSCASRLDVDLASSGGGYAEALIEYTEKGKTVPATPGDFVTTLDATVNGRDGIKHKINLIEMSGEEFAFQIAKNPDGAVSFEDMGTGATELLKNDNNKVFFIIIDPTASIVPFTHRYIKEYSEETGDPIYDFEQQSVNQRLVIKKLIDLFAKPENEDIMKKVDAIHFIMTKSDTLDNLGNRDDEALKIFETNYHDLVLDKIISLGEEYSINEPTRHHPKLFTFSLGQFFIGNYYEYDNTDADKLVKAIKNSTHGVMKENFWSKLKKAVN